MKPVLAGHGEGFGHGKLILMGEHSVVYGHRAIAASIDRGATAHVAPTTSHGPCLLIEGKAPTASSVALEEAFEAIVEVFSLKDSDFEVDVHFDIFPGAGLGSSAAWAVAVARALCEACELRGADADAFVDQATLVSEKVFHGQASGIDQSAAMGRGLFAFTRRSAGPPCIETLNAPAFDVAVGLAGPPSSTAQMVADVAAMGEHFPAITSSIHETIAAVAAEGASALEAGDLQRVGTLMNINHGLLCALGVSTLELNTACELARSCGALGAKLTGAGGGGCVVALAGDDVLEDILNTWKTRGWSAFRTTINHDL